MADPARRRATYEDVLRAPEGCIAQIINGELHTQPRPAGPHQSVAAGLTDVLGLPFRRGKGGPGGWILLDEPELHLGPEIIVPDMAGWRRERMATVQNVAYFTLVPDWVCEILSPSTARIDRIHKLPIYARHAVRHVWIVDPLERTLEIFRLEGERLFLHATHADDQRLRAEPFDAVELDLSVLWADLEPK